MPPVVLIVRKSDWVEKKHRAATDESRRESKALRDQADIELLLWRRPRTRPGLLEAPDDDRRYSLVAATVVVDDLNDHASIALAADPDRIVELNSHRLVPRLFTVPGLLRMGK